jgi:[amino group carrier protein]-lysine/ornithine hydrolase
MIQTSMTSRSTKQLTQIAGKDQKKKETRIQLGEKILAAYSPSGEEEEIVSILKAELESHNLSPRVDSAGNIICEIGSGQRSLLFCPHLDTVPGRLNVRRDGTKLYARGACDAKGPLLSLLFAFEDIAEQLDRGPDRSQGRLIFAGVVEEEKESRGLDQIIRDGLRADGAIFGEPCGLTKVTIGYRGHVPVSFEIKTKEAHASAPWTTTNAAEVAFSLYGSLAKKLTVDGNAQGVDSVSVAITGIGSGTAHNVIPGIANMSVDIRVPIGGNTSVIVTQIYEIVSEEMKSKDCKISTSFASSTEPYKTPLNSNLVRAMNRSMLKRGLRPSYVTKSGTGDMNTYALAFGVDALTYGPGESKLSHTDNEWVDMEEVFACSEVLVDTQKEFFLLRN